MEKHGLCCKKSLIKKDVFFSKEQFNSYRKSYTEGDNTFERNYCIENKDFFWKETFGKGRLM